MCGRYFYILNNFFKLYSGLQLGYLETVSFFLVSFISFVRWYPNTFNLSYLCPTTEVKPFFNILHSALRIMSFFPPPPYDWWNRDHYWAGMNSEDILGGEDGVLL